jgi:hypothetical protein
LNAGERSEVRDSGAIAEEEILKPLNGGDWSEVCDSGAKAEVEGLELFKARRWREIRESGHLSLRLPITFPIRIQPPSAQVKRLQIWQVSQTRWELTQFQVAKVQDLSLLFPGLLDPPLRLRQVAFHDDGMLSNQIGE